MTSSRLRARSVACALLATSAWSALDTGTAFAQSSPPPRFEQVDSNGVDLVNGAFVFSMTEGSIGSGEGAVSLVRGNRSDYGRTDQWSGRAYKRTSGGTTLLYVEFGDVAETFTVSGSTYTSTEANGGTLVDSTSGFNVVPTGYTYTGRDGTVIQYRTKDDDGTTLYPMQGPGCSLADSGTCGIPMSITKPNGMTFTLNWDMFDRCNGGYDAELNCLGAAGYFRFKGVTSSANYGFTFNYSTDNVTGSPAPQPAWYQRTGATFTNAASPPASPPTVAYASITNGEQVTAMGGRVWQFTSPPDGTYRVRRPGSSSDDIIVSYSGGVVSQVVKDGVTTNYSRSVSGSTATMTITDALSRTTTVVSDLTIGRPTSVTDANGKTTSFTYDSAGRLTRTTYPENNYVALTYDARGNVTQSQAVAKDGVTTLTSTASYPSSCTNVVTCNKPTATTDASGNTTDYTYDSTHGGLLTATAPAPTSGATRPQVRYSYSQVTAVAGQPVYVPTGTSACQTGSSCAGTSDEAKTSIAYNASNLLPVSTSAGDGTGALTATTAMAYDSIGNLTSVDGPLAGTADTIVYRYNDAREQVGTVSPDPDGAGPLKNPATRTTYDSRGLVTKVEQGTVNSQSDADWAAFTSLQEVDTTYDTNRRPVTQSLASGGTTYALTQASYDPAGRVQCVAQRMNTAAYGSLPSDACTLGTAGSYGNDRIVKTSYDWVGRVNLVQTGYGVTGVQADEVATTYTDNGQKASVTDAENNKTTYVYDGFDRLYQTLYPSATKGAGTSNSANYEQLGYDSNSNVTSRRTRAGETLTFTFDALNRVTGKSVPASASGAAAYSVAYGYDLLGRMTYARFGSSAGAGVTNAFDALGRLSSTSTNMDGTARSISYTYDAGGNRLSMSMSSGYYLSYAYDTLSRMTSISESGPNTIAQIGYDQAARRSSLALGSGGVFGSSVSYGYDAVGRLTSMGHDLAGTGWDQSLAFSYNPAGQIASQSASNDLYASNTSYNVNRNYSANGLNQYSAAGAATFAYDGNGNLTSDGSSSFVYDAENKLVSRSNGTTLSYDPLGRLWQISGPSETTRFVYDGDRLTEEYDTSGTRQRAYTHGPGTDEPLVWYELTGGAMRRYLHSDQLGSITGVNDEYGNALAFNGYDENGIRNSGNWGRFEYTGQVWLTDLGMYYYKARVYSPYLGRFMQTDPIGYGDGMNWYNYVHSDPVSGVDPTGTTLVSCTGSILLHKDCAGVNFLSVNGQDTAAVQMAIDNAKAGQLTAFGVVVCVQYCNNPASGNQNLKGEYVVYAPPVYALAASAAPNLPPPSIRPDGLADWLYENAAEAAKNAYDAAKSYVKGCVAGASSVSPTTTAQDAVRGGVKGAAKAGARGAVLGELVGPEGAAAGGATAAVGGAAKGTVSGGAKSLVRQACHAGNQ